LEEVERVADPQAAKARLASLENDLVEGMSSDGWANGSNNNGGNNSGAGPGNRSMASLMTEITGLR
jgi:hypothetical protein